jgi:hypothetical protein
MANRASTAEHLEPPPWHRALRELHRWGRDAIIPIRPHRLGAPASAMPENRAGKAPPARFSGRAISPRCRRRIECISGLLRAAAGHRSSWKNHCSALSIDGVKGESLACRMMFSTTSSIEPRHGHSSRLPSSRGGLRRVTENLCHDAVAAAGNRFDRASQARAKSLLSPRTLFWLARRIVAAFSFSDVTVKVVPAPKPATKSVDKKSRSAAAL